MVEHGGPRFELVPLDDAGTQVSRFVDVVARGSTGRILG
jgi:hypothetical protein